jgi:methylated-DNA-[protein]-cysteine S-methyltransferase
LRAGIAGVPYGETLTYGALARLIDSAPRAVGQACKRNPFPIIIPCHRVTSASGPEHYSGGAGISTKAWLLDFEQPWPKLL